MKLLLLFLTLTAQAATSSTTTGSKRLKAKNFEVHGLGDIVEAFDEFDGRMYAGQMPTSRDPDEWEDSKFMFWLFLPSNPVALDTLTIWHNGGPGCSSFHGGLYENAPVSTPHYPAGYPKTDLQPPLLKNEWGWTRATNMLYVEMPQGVGFSSGPAPESEFDIGHDMYGFLQNFYDTFPELRPKKLFLFGESYAGYYVPSIAHKIHQENSIAPEEELINLEGIGLGNGWIEAATQGPAVIDFAWWHGLIDSSTKDSLHQVWKDCQSGTVEMSPPFHDFTVPDECSIMSAVMAAAGAEAFPAESFRSPNPYDVTTFDLYPVLFGTNSSIEQFYNNPLVKKALHAPEGVYWEGCIPGAGRRRRRRLKTKEGHDDSSPSTAGKKLPGQLLLAHDKPESVAPYIAELLDAGIRVLIYNGDRDLTTCAQGSEMVLNQMKWSGHDEWQTADRGLWMVDNEVAGYSKNLDGLQFVVVYNAGHLLPNSNPTQALDLITRFVTDRPFLDIGLPRFENASTHSKAAKQEQSQGISHESSNTPFNEPISHLLFVVALAAACFALGYVAATYQSRGGRKQEYTILS